MLSTLFRGEIFMINNKKGHFDFATLVIAILGGIIAYIISQTNTIKQLYKNKFRTKSEKALRFWK